MKLEVPYKIVDNVSQDLIDETLSLIDFDHWLLDDTRTLMGNLENTQTIFVRYFNDYKNNKSEFWKDHIVNHPLFDRYSVVTEKFLEKLKKHYNITNYICFFAKLSAHSNVGLHGDGGPFLEQCHRIHIPIKTNKDVFYIIENKKYNWTVGNIYEFDNTRIHGVLNDSDEDRIHLMFNIYE